MAKTAEELQALKEEIDAVVEKLKTLSQDELDQVAGSLKEWDVIWKKSGISRNFEEDTVPVSDKDISAGLRNY